MFCLFNLNNPNLFHDDPGYIMTSSNGSIFRVTGLCAGNSPVSVDFPAQRPVTRSFDIFLFDLRLNKRLSEQPWGSWFETSSCPLWRHCYVWYSVLVCSHVEICDWLLRDNELTHLCKEISVCVMLVYQSCLHLNCCQNLNPFPWQRSIRANHSTLGQRKFLVVEYSSKKVESTMKIKHGYQMHLVPSKTSIRGMWVAYILPPPPPPLLTWFNFNHSMDK